MMKLSIYILTKNSERYLLDILLKVVQIADEIIVLDSGSTDGTENITRQFPQCTFYNRLFDNFKNQRNFAISLCANDYIMFVDSDELPDQKLIDSIFTLKLYGFEHDAYEMNREWIVLGKRVRCIYPVKTPDSPIRLLNKKYVSFENSSLVHEAPSGYRSIGKLSGNLWHHTFHTREELYAKLNFYTDIAAQDIIRQNKRITWLDLKLKPVLVFCKWYIFNKGFMDGIVGLRLAFFGYKNVKAKYQKARGLKFQSGH